MVDESVMVTFIQKKVYTFVLVEMNCKINSLGGAKIPFLYINDAMERYYI